MVKQVKISALYQLYRSRTQVYPLFVYSPIVYVIHQVFEGVEMNTVRELQYMVTSKRHSTL